MLRSTKILRLKAHRFDRPVDEENLNIDGATQDDEQFNYDAVPTRFFFDVETVGGLDPDQIVLQGISNLQRKLAEVINELQGGGDGMEGGDFGGAQSPQMNGAGFGGPDQGFTTPYGNASAWGGQPGGSTTPYGATPYGNSGGGPAW